MFRKKSKYKHVIINKKKYYFHTIDWMDITGDAGHATAEEFNKFILSWLQINLGSTYSHP